MLSIFISLQKLWKCKYADCWCSTYWQVRIYRWKLSGKYVSVDFLKCASIVNLRLKPEIMFNSTEWYLLSDKNAWFYFIRQEVNDIWWMVLLKFILRRWILVQQVGEEWDDSLQTKEQIEAKVLQRQEAALKRERALAYSFSHQVPWLPHLWFYFILFFYFSF